MDRVSSLIFPGSRTLAGWWRQLTPLQPLALSIGYGFLHRIEAPVNVAREQPVDPLALHVLQAVALDGDEAGLRERLGLPAAVVQRVLAGMLADSLIVRAADNHWQPAERGRDALERGSLTVQIQERRAFPFLERLNSAGERVGPPLFVPMSECVGVSWQVDPTHAFDLAELQRTVEQARAWKESAAFPLDVESLANGPALESWQRVVVDRPERVMLALIRANREVQGFAVKTDGWTLLDRGPVLTMPAPADGVWPADSPMAVWQEGWRSWCKQRQLPASEVEACTLAYNAPRLEVQAPPRLVQRLQAAKSDLFKGEAWLLAGDGYLRTAAQLTMRS